MSGNYYIGCKQNSDNSSFDTHLHDQYEINFILTDDITVVVNNNLYKSKCGDVFIFPPFSFHCVNTTHKKYDRLLLFFNDKSVLEKAAVLTPAIRFLKDLPVNCIHLNHDETETMKNLIANAADTEKLSGLFAGFETICALGHILSFIIDKVDVNISPDAVVHKKTENISKILSYITENLDTELSVKEICDKFNISKSALWTLMHNSVGISIKEYIIKIRISHAIDLLTNGLSVTEVSNRCGFNSYAHFIRTFSKIVGSSPYKYGKEHSR